MSSRPTTRSTNGSKSTWPLPTEKSRTSKRKIEQLEAEGKEKDKKLALLQKQVAYLQAENDGLPTKKPRASHTFSREEKEWIGRIWKATKSAIWSGCKFITKEKKLIRATKSVLETMNLKEFANLPDGKQKDAKISAWIAENKEHVRTGMNDVRNYSQGEVRKVVVERLITNQKVPTPAQILDCATRTNVGEGQANQEHFDFYVDVLLPKVALKENWDTNYRHYQTVSEAHHQGKPNKKCITVSTEAFLVLIFMNCYFKWIYLADCKKKGIKENRSSPDFATPWTDVKAGQQKWGGWNDGGRALFKEICKKVDDGRKQDSGKEAEKACLVRLRTKHNVEEKDKNRAAKGRKSRAAIVESESEDEYDNI